MHGRFAGLNAEMEKFEELRIRVGRRVSSAFHFALESLGGCFEDREGYLAGGVLDGWPKMRQNANTWSPTIRAKP